MLAKLYLVEKREKDFGNEKEMSKTEKYLSNVLFIRCPKCDEVIEVLAKLDEYGLHINYVETDLEKRKK